MKKLLTVVALSALAAGAANSAEPKDCQRAVSGECYMAQMKREYAEQRKRADADNARFLAEQAKRDAAIAKLPPGWYAPPDCAVAWAFMNPDRIEAGLRQSGTFGWRQNTYFPDGRMATATIVDISGRVFRTANGAETCNNIR